MTEKKIVAKTSEECEAERKQWEKDHPILNFLEYDVYYPLYRFCSNYLNPMNYYREAKYFIQRGLRGWSDRDVWSVYYHHAKVTKEMLTHLKKVCHIMPMWEEGKTEEQAVKEWDDILDCMIKAFDSAEKIGIGDLELYHESFFREDRAEFNKMMSEKYGCKYQTKEEYDKMQEGFKLFFKHYWSLWD